MPLKKAKLTCSFEVETKKETLIPNMLRRGRPADILLRDAGAERPPADILPREADAERPPSGHIIRSGGRGADVPKNFFRRRGRPKTAPCLTLGRGGPPSAPLPPPRARCTSLVQTSIFSMFSV